MTRMTIKSRKLHREFHFWMPDGGGYVCLESTDRYGHPTNRQICEGGGFSGSTIRCADEDDFAATCRRWYRQYLKAEEMVTQ